MNPDLSLVQRRRELKPWAFGTCACTRCRREELDEGGAGKDVQLEDLPGLEEELRHGLGFL